MKHLFLVANWKANKTEGEAKKWIDEISGCEFSDVNKEIIVCAPFTLLSFLQSEIEKQKLPIQLGAENVSQFSEGAHTGEVTAQQVKELAKYVIIGHSERRKEFGETDELLSEKVAAALSAGLVPIYCVSNTKQPIPPKVTIVAYEPLSAIGTGNPDTPENANEVSAMIKQKNSLVMHVLYGGSVTGENVASFTEMENIDGVLIGGASLDAKEFAKIINA